VNVIARSVASIRRRYEDHIRRMSRTAPDRSTAIYTCSRAIGPSGDLAARTVDNRLLYRTPERDDFLNVLTERERGSGWFLTLNFGKKLCIAGYGEAQ
jgi:hypothetical protein